MPDSPLPDYYEALQVSPRADRETIERLFRYLANRFHPDNRESGNSEKFTELMDAHSVLSDPVKRAAYDVRYERFRESRWRLFDQTSATSEIASDAQVRVAMLSLLYVARRNNSAEPGVGIVELERVLACPHELLGFQVWYMRENGWIERLTSGHFAITARGVDKLFELGGPPTPGHHLLNDGTRPAKVRR